MKQTVIRCDTCGEIGAETFTQSVDRIGKIEDGYSDEESIFVDLCPQHTSLFLKNVLGFYRAYASIQDHQWRDLFQVAKKYDFTKDEAGQ